MAVSVQTLIDLSDSYIRDKTVISSSLADKIAAISEATLWLLTTNKDDQNVKTVGFSFYPGINEYNLKTNAPDFLMASDLRRNMYSNMLPATFKSVREMQEDIATETLEFSYGIDRADKGLVALINLPTTTTTLPIVPSASTFTISNTTVPTEYNFTPPATLDLTSYANNGAVIVGFRVNSAFQYTLPSASFKLKMAGGSYALITVTTSSTLQPLRTNEDHVLVFNVANASYVLGTEPQFLFNAITELSITFKADATGTFAINNLAAVLPERLTLRYLSGGVGATSTGSLITRFTATNDVPYFSDVYDNYQYAVAHMTASILFSGLRLANEAEGERRKATEALITGARLFPSSVVNENRTFKAFGLDFKSRKIR